MVLQDLPATPVVPVTKETRGPRAGTDLLEPRVSEARTGYKENAARLGPEGSEVEWEDLAVSASPDPRGTLVSQARLGRWGNKEFLDLRGPEDHLVSQGCLEYPGKMDPQDRPESEAHLENMVHLDPRETRESPDRQAQLVRRDRWESLARLDLQESQETLADREKVVRRDLRGLQARKVDQVYPDPLDYLDFLERGDFLAFQECPD